MKRRRRNPPGKEKIKIFERKLKIYSLKTQAVVELAYEPVKASQVLRWQGRHTAIDAGV